MQYGPAASVVLVLSLVTVPHSEPRTAQTCQFTPLNSSDVIVAHVWSCALYGFTALPCFVLYWRHRLHTNLYWRRLNIMRRSQWSRCPSRGLRPLACWDCGFESRMGHGYLSLVSVVCCQVEVSASKGVLPSVVCLSVIMNPRWWGGLCPLALLRHGKNKKYRALISLLNCRMWPTHKSSHTVGLPVVFCISYVHACIRVCVCACSFRTQRTYSLN